MSGIRAVSKWLVAATFALGFALVIVGCDEGGTAPAGGTGAASTTKEVAGQGKDASAKNVKGAVDFGAGIPSK
ncbi:MAG: hypothetical protein SFX72_08205 [Isosphaeraceae bacterium]|nr:hypothetical protein [Isosphaeraceae bacterium]